MNLDVLVFASHPDDAEITMGGTIIKLTDSGYKIGIIDLTKGELGTRGNEKTREKEASKASEILGVSIRNNLGLPDGKLKPDDKFLKVVVEQIRKYKPSLIFAPYWNDRHPDHSGTSRLVKEAYFFSGLPKYKTYPGKKNQEAYRPDKLIYYMQTYEFSPTFIVDISETFERKMESIRSYGTQFHNPELKSDEPETFISQPKFLKYLEARAAVFGFKIGKDYGEPFYCEEQIEMDFSTILKKER